MGQSRIRVLIVEDNEGDAVYLQKLLSKVETAFESKVVGWLSSAIQTVELEHFDCVLLDLTLPDSQGVDTVIEFLGQAPSIPVIVMTGYDDTRTAINAVRTGAQDYILKNEVQARSLERAVLYAIERRHADMVGKKLTYASLAQLQEASEDDGPAVSMLRDHIAQVVRAVEAIRIYIQRNAPAHSDAIDALFQKFDLDLVLREMRDILKLDENAGRKRRSISQSAMEAVDHISTKETSPSDRPSAEESVLDIIERRQKYGDE